MADTRILVDLQRCTGCWTCAMACKVGHQLEDDDWRITVRTLGSGEGIDRPAGQWPKLKESWQPIWHTSCIKCSVDRTSTQGRSNAPYCVYSCPNSALTWGEEVDAKIEELRQRDFRIFELPAFENSKDNVIYATKQ